MERDAQLPLMPALTRLFSGCGRSPLALLASMILSGLIYYLLGRLGWMFSSEVTGLPYVWPSSGVAFVAVLVGGYWLLFAPIIGMLLLAIELQQPVSMALGAGVGATLEALVPVLLLRCVGFDLRLERIRDVMRFVAVAVILGPMFSATLGTLGISYGGESSPLALASIWLFWWLGNSVGCLVIAGALLAWSTSGQDSMTLKSGLFLFSLLVGVVLVGVLGVLQWSVGQPTLLLIAPVPMIVFAAAYLGSRGATLLSVGATAASLFAMYSVSHRGYVPHVVEMFSLDLALIGVAAFTGLVLASAYSEHGAGAKYAYLAEHDGLTGLINRTAFETRLTRAIGSAQRDGRIQMHALMFIDLDDFKRINDLFGHAAGDHVLCQLSGLLLAQVRSRDTVARLGGDEFVVLLEHCTTDAARQMAERIAAGIRKMSIPGGEGVCQVTASIGVVSIGAGSGGIESVLSAADAAHYQAKGAGKDQVHQIDGKDFADQC